MTRDEAMRDAVRAIRECFPDRWEEILDRLEISSPNDSDFNARYPVSIDLSTLPAHRILRFSGGHRRALYGPARVGRDSAEAHSPHAAMIGLGETLEWDGPGYVIQSPIIEGVFPTGR